MTATPPPGATSRSQVYPEVQALRAIAVLGVVVYHLWPTRLSGGYVGVDVFFVISGFLITAHLLRELTSTGSLRLGTFYARRARRLLPAALLVTIATAVATLVFLPLRELTQVFREILASTLYVENWALAFDSVDYLAQTNIASPVQHYWSLSVEEQFYIVWPLLLLAGWIRSRRSSARITSKVTGIAAVLTLVLVGSLALSVVLTWHSPGPAYFGTHTRAWEFAAGGLVALVYRRSNGTSRSRSLMAWVGLAFIAGAMLLFDDATPFPGYAALLPVVGTVLVILAGNPANGWAPKRLFELRPVAFLGDVSYSLYLWHWPLIVIAPYVLSRDLNLVERLLVIVIAVALSTLTKRLVEDPARFSRVLVGRPYRTTFTLGAVAMVTVASLSIAVIVSATTRIEEKKGLAELALANSGDCLGAGSLIYAACSEMDLGDPLTPSTDSARTDDVNTVECWSSSGIDELRVCSEGPKLDPALRVALVGDSHSNQYLSAMKRLARDHGWRFDVYGKSGCIWTAAVQEQSNEWIESCESWKSKLNERLLTVEPYDAIITSYSTVSKIRASEGKTLEETVIDGFVDVWTPVTRRGSQIVAIRDNPQARADYLSCIDSNPQNPNRKCSVLQSDAFAGFDGQADAVSLVPRSHFLDLTEYFCPEEVCSPVIGGVLVYRDYSHLTSTYARTLSPILRSGILTATGLVENGPE